MLTNPRLFQQTLRFKKVYVEPERLVRWVRQFDPADRGTAIDLLAQTTLIDYPDFLRSLRRLHGNVLASLKEDGFVTNTEPLTSSRVDFTRPFTARSGDLVSYFYRKHNHVRSAQFFNTEQLAKQAASDRALVIVDDYAGTGAQLLLEYLGKGYHANFAGYGKIYVAVAVANRKAIERAARLKAGQHERIGREVNDEFGLTGEAAARILAAAAAIDPEKVEFIFDRQEVSRSDPPNSRQDAFLRKYGRFQQNPSAPFGAGNVSGSTLFFYGAPNSLPDIFWNSLGTYGGRALIPLVPRTEDISHYDFAGDLPADQQVWGGDL